MIIGPNQATDWDRLVFFNALTLLVGSQEGPQANRRIAVDRGTNEYGRHSV